MRSMFKGSVHPVHASLILFACLLLFNGSAQAQADDVQIFDAPGPVTTINQGEDDPRDPKFHVPDSEDPAFYVQIPRALGVEKVAIGDYYKRGFNVSGAQAFLCGILPGFDVYRINVSLYFAEPCTITLKADLQLADVSDPSCPLPDSLLCASAPTTFTIPVAGTYSLGIPIDCDCVSFIGDYFYGVTIVDFDCPTAPGITTGAFPHLCTNYLDSGAGWVDMVATYPSFPGDFVIWGDGVCCDDPVGLTPGSWGMLKKMFDAVPD